MSVLHFGVREILTDYSFRGTGAMHSRDKNAANLLFFNIPRRTKSHPRCLGELGTAEWSGCSRPSIVDYCRLLLLVLLVVVMFTYQTP